MYFLGSRLVIQEVKIVFAYLLRSFNIFTTENTPMISIKNTIGTINITQNLNLQLKQRIKNIS